MSPKEGPRDHVDYPRSLMWRPEGLRQVFLFGCWRGGLTTKKTLGRGGQGLIARLLKFILGPSCRLCDYSRTMLCLPTLGAVSSDLTLEADSAMVSRLIHVEGIASSRGGIQLGMLIWASSFFLRVVRSLLYIFSNSRYTALGRTFIS